MKTSSSKEKTSIEIIDEIHSKFDTASERVLLEAKQIILNGSNDKFEKLERLSNLGFSNSKEVKAAKEQFEKMKLAKERADCILHFQTHYPQKYIFVEDVRKICVEYHLLLGSDRDYIESIPEKSQNEILNFKLREEDFIYYMGEVRVTEQTLAKGSGILEWREIDKDSYNLQTDNGKHKQIGSGRNQKNFICNKDYFAIAATPDMFDLKGRVVEGIDILQKVEWPDPIVLKAVKYGYLIIAKWGQEALIEAFQNERDN